MGIRYAARVEDMPYRSAWEGMNEKGRNMPQKKQKVPAVVRMKGSSPTGRMKSMRRNCFRRWTSRDFMVKLVMIRRKRIKKPQILIAQPKPRRLKSRVSMMGRITPPRLAPLVAMPRARARRWRNQVLMELMLAWKRALVPMGLQMPCAKRIW